ncbi:MAG: hypothetical protein V9G24_11315 [Rhodoblastus sp.]
MNKSAVANSVSQLYQTNYSGRAETGLTGDDRFRIKVSADGAAWRDALSVDPATGMVSLPQTAGLANGLATLDASGKMPAAQLPASAGAGLAGFRNRLRNATFLHQPARRFGGAVTLAAGAYGHDGVQGGRERLRHTRLRRAALDTTITIIGRLADPADRGQERSKAAPIACRTPARRRRGSGKERATPARAPMPPRPSPRRALQPARRPMSSSRPALSSGRSSSPARPTPLSSGGHTRSRLRCASAITTGVRPPSPTTSSRSCRRPAAWATWGKLFDLPVEMRVNAATVGISNIAHFSIMQHERDGGISAYEFRSRRRRAGGR